MRRPESRGLHNGHWVQRGLVRVWVGERPADDPLDPRELPIYFTEAERAAGHRAYVAGDRSPLVVEQHREWDRLYRRNRRVAS